jgi:hypothetical protein
MNLTLTVGISEWSALRPDCFTPREEAHKNYW